MLKKVISGGQTGSDFAGLETAKEFGFRTGGLMPYGFKTLDGCKPEYKDLFGCTTHTSSSYVPRTKLNVKNSDGTIRLAFDFSSPGEICTFEAIKYYKKPYIDVDLANPRPVEDVVNWLNENNIKTLNVAGNSEKTAPGSYEAAKGYLKELFTQLS
jgi:hypothetical protein